MIPTRHTQDLLLGTWELLGQLGQVPRRLIWDDESGIGRPGRLPQEPTRLRRYGLLIVDRCRHRDYAEARVVCLGEYRLLASPGAA